MQVAEADGVDWLRVQIVVERAERAGPEIEHQGERAARVRGLDQVAGGGRLRPGHRAAAADDGQHDHRQANCSTPTTRPLISRDPMPSKAAGLPVVR